MEFSFMALVKKTGELPNKTIARTGDPLSIAKAAVMKALDEQKGYVTLSESGQALPRTKGGTKTVSTWFTKTQEGYWTSLRYGQLPIPIGEGTGLFIGTADELKAFYDAVKESIQAGQMDGVIGELQKKRSAALTGRTGKRGG